MLRIHATWPPFPLCAALPAAGLPGLPRLSGAGLRVGAGGPQHAGQGDAGHRERRPGRGLRAGRAGDGAHGDHHRAVVHARQGRLKYVRSGGVNFLLEGSEEGLRFSKGVWFSGRLSVLGFAVWPYP